MHGLAGDAQGVPDLLPRPALFPGRGDVVRLDSLRQAMQRQRGAKPNCGVIRRDTQLEILDIHACQSKLTPRMCQSKLTYKVATPDGPDRRFACADKDVDLGMDTCTRIGSASPAP